MEYYTNIVHVLFTPIVVGNFVHDGGLRLQSLPTESLVVKLSDYGSNFDRMAGAGITATGSTTNANDRIGGNSACYWSARLPGNHDQFL